MIDPEEKLNRLLAMAREERREAPAATPFGFATRVASRAMARPAQTILRSWESLSLRFLGGAVAVMVAAAVFSAVNMGQAAESADDMLLELADETFDMALFP